MSHWTEGFVLGIERRAVLTRWVGSLRKCLAWGVVKSFRIELGDGDWVAYMTSWLIVCALFDTECVRQVRIVYRKSDRDAEVSTEWEANINQCTWHDQASTGGRRPSRDECAARRVTRGGERLHPH